jgi:hypothetical protein
VSSSSSEAEVACWLCPLAVDSQVIPEGHTQKCDNPPCHPSPPLSFLSLSLSLSLSPKSLSPPSPTNPKFLCLVRVVKPEH